MYCIKCGNQLEEGVAVCSICGARTASGIVTVNEGVVSDQQFQITPVNEQTISAIRRLLDPLRQLANLNNNLAQEERLLERFKQKKSNMPGYIIGGILLGFLVCGYIVGVFATSISGSGMLGLCSALLCGIAGVLFGITMGVYDDKKKSVKIRESEAFIEDCLVKIDNICEDINEEDISLLPPDYRFYNAADFFYHAFTNQRALTMQQAVNLYEDEIRKDNIALMQQQQMLALQQQANSLRSIRATSAVSATMSTLNFISKLF